MIYLYLAIATIVIFFICKGAPIMKDMIKHDNGEYEIHIHKKEHNETKKPDRTAAEILSEMYKNQKQ